MNHRRAIAEHLADALDGLIRSLESLKAALAFYAEVPDRSPGPQTGPTAEQLGYITIKEAAQHLKISPGVLYDLCRPYRAHLNFPAVRIGNRFRVNASKLDAWLANGGAKALSNRDPRTGRHVFPEEPLREKPRPVHYSWHRKPAPPPPPLKSTPPLKQDRPQPPDNEVDLILCRSVSWLPELEKAMDAFKGEPVWQTIFDAYNELLQSALELQDAAVKAAPAQSLMARYRMFKRRHEALRRVVNGITEEDERRPRLMEALNRLTLSWDGLKAAVRDEVNERKGRPPSRPER